MNVNDISMLDMVGRRLHHGNGRYVNPFNPNPERGLVKALKWRLFSENHFKHLYDEESVKPVHIDWGPVSRHRGLSITFINHACVLVRDRGATLLLDPVFFGLFPPIRDFTPLRFDVKAMPAPDHILITHGHYDHLDRATLKSIAPGAHLISPLGYGGLFEGLGAGRRTELDWLEGFNDGRREIILLPCNHWTMRNPLAGPNRSLWGSYLLRTASGANIFIAGDTAYFRHFREIGERFRIDVAIFNLGAYTPRWMMQESHMNPEETLQAFRDIGADRMLIVHWGTFRLGDEPVHMPPLDFRSLLAREAMMDRLIDLSHGQTVYL